MSSVTQSLSLYVLLILMLLVLLVLKRSALPLPGPVAVPPLCAHRSAALRAMAALTRSKTSSITTAMSSGTNIGWKRESLVLLSLAAPDRTLLLSGKTLQSLVLLSLAAPDRTLLLSGKTLPLSFPWRSGNRLAPSVLFSLAKIRGRVASSSVKPCGKTRKRCAGNVRSSASPPVPGKPWTKPTRWGTTCRCPSKPS